MLASGYVVQPAERRSWRESLGEFAGHLTEAGLGEIDVLVEYQSAHGDVSRRGGGVASGGD
ncbi:hypothetical protein [Micromonospora sp. NPDC005254]|uniref:hypothetical protein n=1 Tax=Micromonospora sp. NPDC005254 TaxID=3364229 RepID=UPI0036B6FE2E